MSAKIIFYIARHGKTILNTLGKVQGWCDSPLTKEGIEVAQYLGRGLKEIEFEMAYISDLRRTRETVEEILKFQGQKDLTIIEKFGLREVCFGSYEAEDTNKLWRETGLFLHYSNGKELLIDVFDPAKEMTYGDILDAVKTLDTLNMAESFEELENRSLKTLKEIAEKESEKNKETNILIVSHGMTIAIMLLNLGGKFLINKPLDNASICKVVYENGKFVVESMGDMTYVEKGMMR